VKRQGFTSKRDTTLQQLVLLAAVCLAVPVAAEAGDGAKFNARDPRGCVSTKASGKGPPSVKIVTDALFCTHESASSSTLYLIEDVKVDVSTKGRPHNRNTDIMSEIDIDVPVYPIRGSYVKYQCSPVSDYMKNAGKNCNIYRQPQASGSCYKTTFGDWKCSMIDLRNNTQEPGVPPPKS
jgi:hypothetical protein